MIEEPIRAAPLAEGWAALSNGDWEGARASFEESLVQGDTPEALEKAQRVMQDLKAVGIDMDAVTLQLQHEGVKSFADSYDQLIQTLEQRRQALARA